MTPLGSFLARQSRAVAQNRVFAIFCKNREKSRKIAILGRFFNRNGRGVHVFHGLGVASFFGLCQKMHYRGFETPKNGGFDDKIMKNV